MRTPDGYISRAPFMQPILEKMREQQEAWADISISAPVEEKK